MVIGITGTDGAGKGSAVAYLVSTYGFTHYSSRDFILAEIRRLGLAEDRSQMRLTANALRAEFGHEVIVKKAYERAAAEGKARVVIESVRALAEVAYLKQQGGVLLAVDARPEVRFERVQARRSSTDQVTYEQFLAHEELERNDPDPSGMQKAKVMELADYTIQNDSTLEDLYNQLDEVMTRLGIARVV